MAETYEADTLGAAVLAHDNDYGDLTAGPVESVPAVSIIVPYYEAVATIDRCLRCITEAIAVAEVECGPLWQAQIVVVDDGSPTAPAIEAISEVLSKRCELISLATNMGRAAARNAGLAASRHEIALFCDADVFVPPEAIARHAMIHAGARSIGRSAITAGLMCFTDWPDIGNLGTCDFRVDCVYDAAWVGCDDDLRFVGRRFRTLEETMGWRSWPSGGWLGPWTIVNLVLGGLFGVDRALAVEVGGCEALIGAYGFVETTLAAKLVALHEAFVIPVDGPPAVHAYVDGVALSATERDRLFRLAHARFFSEFLRRES